MPRAFLVAIGLLIGASAHASAQVTRLPKLQLSSPLNSQPPAPAAIDSIAPSAAADEGQASNAQQLARQLGELKRLQQEIDELRQATGTPSQVLLKFRMVEISLTRLGMVRQDESMRNCCDPALVDSILAAKDHPLKSVVFGADFNALLEALSKEQIATTLAEHSLKVSSGSPASFQQGLEVPVAKREGEREWVEYQKVGIEGQANVTALGNNRVRIDLRYNQDSSSLETKTALEHAQAGKRWFEFNAGAETTLGQTVALHSVVNVRSSAEKRVVPVLGELPLIGNLFSKNTERKDEVLTLLLVTPESIREQANVAQGAAVAEAPEYGQQRSQLLLEKKRAELKAAQQEVDRLRHLCRQVQQVVASVKVLEMSLPKLKQLQLELGGSDASLIERLLAGQPLSGSDDTERFGLMLQHMRKDHTATIYSEPVLAAFVGRPAELNSGGLVPVVVDEGMGGVGVKTKKHGTVDVLYKKFGTEIGFTPIAVTDSRAQLHLHVRVSEIDDETKVELKDIKMPGFRVRDVQTDVDAPLGQVTIVYAATRRGVVPAETSEGNKRTARIEEVITLVLVTPSVTDSPRDQVQPPPVIAPAASVARSAPESAAASGPPIQVECRVIEIDVTKLRAMGFDFNAVRDAASDSRNIPMAADGSARDPLLTLVFSDDPAAKSFVETLLCERVAKIVARPQLATLAGQQAEVRVGHEIDVPAPGDPGQVGKDFIGTQLRVLPRIDDKGRISMEFKLRVSKQGEACPFKIDDKMVYRVESFATETTVTVEDGKTTVLGGLHSGVVQNSQRIRVAAKSKTPQDGLPANGVSRYVLATACIVRPTPPATLLEAKSRPSPAKVQPK